MENNYILNPNPLVQFLQKEQKDFTLLGKVFLFLRFFGFAQNDNARD